MNDLQDQCRQRTYRVFVSEEQGVFCSLHVCSWGVCAVEDHFGQFVLVFGLPRHTVVNETTVGRPKNGKSAEREHCDQLDSAFSDSVSFGLALSCHLRSPNLQAIHLSEVLLISIAAGLDTRP